MLEYDSFMPLAFLKKEAFHGSRKGMRYRVAKGENSTGEAVLTVCIWPEPYCFEKTEEDKKQYRDFNLSEEGRKQAIDWLNEQFTIQIALWELSGPQN